MNKKYFVSMIVVIALAISALAPAANAFTIGQRGSDVSDLQAMLIEAGFDIPAITSGGASFGYFGPQTQASLKAYTASKGSTESNPILGAVSGPDNFLPYWGVNDNRTYFYSQNVLAASTTCSFRLPLAASTTLDTATARLDQIASTTVFEIGYSVNPAATTTLIAQKTITTATQDAVIATSTFGWGLAALTPPYVFAPGSYINYKLGGGAIQGTNAPRGVCKLIVHAI